MEQPADRNIYKHPIQEGKEKSLTHPQNKKIPVQKKHTKTTHPLTDINWGLESEGE